MELTHLLEWLEQQPFAVTIAESYWFPAIEIVHVFAIATVVGSISILDFRLIGIGSVKRSVTEVVRTVLPWTWIFFAVAVLTGFLLFSSKATGYWENPAFRIKMVCLLLAGTNMLTFHLVTAKGITKWDRGRLPWPAKIAGGLSLTLWVLVVSSGRWIGFISLTPGN